MLLGGNNYAFTLQWLSRLQNTIWSQIAPWPEKNPPKGVSFSDFIPLDGQYYESTWKSQESSYNTKHTYILSNFKANKYAYTDWNIQCSNRNEIIDFQNESWFFEELLFQVGSYYKTKYKQI